MGDLEGTLCRTRSRLVWWLELANKGLLLATIVIQKLAKPVLSIKLRAGCLGKWELSLVGCLDFGLSSSDPFSEALLELQTP